MFPARHPALSTLLGQMAAAAPAGPHCLCQTLRQSTFNLSARTCRLGAAHRVASPTRFYTLSLPEAFLLACTGSVRVAKWHRHCRHRHWTWRSGRSLQPSHVYTVSWGRSQLHQHKLSDQPQCGCPVSLERLARDILRRVCPRMSVVDEIHHLLASSVRS